VDNQKQNRNVLLEEITMGIMNEKDDLVNAIFDLEHSVNMLKSMMESWNEGVLSNKEIVMKMAVKGKDLSNEAMAIMGIE
jgi:hypothetical protein